MGLLLAAFVPGTALAVPGTAGAVATSGAPGSGCSEASSPFTPPSVEIPGVVGRTRVLALGRDQNGVPRPPPLTDDGKRQLAWDKASRIRPGGPRGVVRLTAHTYPRDGSHGTALGNELLARLRTGDRVLVSGGRGELLCYEVTRQVQVRAERSLPGYYASTGAPRLAILVCSGRRRGPGDWSHRTVWFAVPVAFEALGGS